MAPSRMSIKFLGTSSMPNATRNYSSLLFKVDNFTVMVDCGESTQRQLQSRYIGGDDRLSNIRTILVTHLHADHVLGIVPLLMSMMGPTGNPIAADQNQEPRVEIFGPVGLRALIRTTLTLCYASLSGKYVVHEFLLPSGAESSPFALRDEPRRPIPHLPQHECEGSSGRDIAIDTLSSSWPHFHSFRPSQNVPRVHISAAPISHRCPTLGYVFEEERSSSPVKQEIIEALTRNGPALLQQRGIRHPLSLLSTLVGKRKAIDLPDGTALKPPALDLPGRKVTIMGDTNDGTGGFTPAQIKTGYGLPALAVDSDVLVHESTNIALPAHLNKNGKADEFEAVAERSAARGHSVPQTAGTFAALIRAKKLVLNHFSTKYPSPPHYLLNDAGVHTQRADEQGADQASNPRKHLGEPERKVHVMKEFELQAYQAWKAAAGTESGEFETYASYDGFSIDVLPRAPDSETKALPPSPFGRLWETEKGRAETSTNGTGPELWDPSPFLLNEQAEAQHAVILLNSPIDDKQKRHFLRLWEAATWRICADGAANRLVDAFGNDAFAKKITKDISVPLPHAILGDLDSIRPEVQTFFKQQGVKVQIRPSQYATDLQKCIQEVEDQEAAGGGAKEYTLVLYGGLAGRLDQSIHTLHVLWQLAPGTADLGGVRDPNADPSSDREGRLKKRRKTFAVGDGSVAWLLAPGKHRLSMDRRILGQTCGILPLGVGEQGASVTTHGLEWDLDGTATTLGGFLSTSNHLAGDNGIVDIQTDRPIYWTVELRPVNACEI